MTPDKDPTTYSLITYAWVLFLAGWGGVVQYYRKVKMGLISRFSFAELIGEIFTSGLTGIITFFLCESAGIDQLMTAALVGITGHMGSRALFSFEHWATKRFGPGNGHHD